MKQQLARVLGAVSALATGLGGAHPLSAQDVELLGQVYGTRPPDAYFEQKAQDTRSFEMVRGRAAQRGLPGVAGEAQLRAPGGEASLTLDNRRVQGTFRFPVILGLFSDSPLPSYARTDVQQYFLTGPNPTGTISQFYREMSGGLVELIGDVAEWRRSSYSQAQVTGGVSALSAGSQIGRFIIELLSQMQGVNWGLYDNDGPDGIPNSGDDDGYVDVLAVIHPTPGAECGGSESLNRIWSHKWNLMAAAGQDFVTTTMSARPGFGPIRVSDYTVQPVSSCSGTSLNEIGVMAHEFGHGFGLPDLYTVSGGQAGSGRWDLMGTGAWGCSAVFEPQRPCHMGAWSKAVLGWVDVVSLPFGTDVGTVALDPVETSHRVLAIPSGDGSGEYLLLENRQRIGFDGALPATGLLIWQIDPYWIDRTLRSNTVNDNAGHMGVWLRQADGLNQLAKTASSQGNRGDAGDPFPGATANTTFHAGSQPASFTHAGVATGVTLTDITEQGQRVSFRLLSRYHTLRVRSAGETGAVVTFTIDGAIASAGEPVIRSAPYQRHTIEATPWAMLSEGVRCGFTGWEDLPGTSRIRAWTTGLEDADLVAVYGGPREVRFAAAVEGSRFDVAPGRILTTPERPDLWFTEGTQVAFEARPTVGFEFHSWKGALAGLPNPMVLVMDQPKDATAVFEMVFGIGQNVTISIPAGTMQEVVLEARHANLPVRWTLLSGALPEGLGFSDAGTINGAALSTGAFPLTLDVVDALGLQASGAVTLQVTVPVIGTASLAATFLLLPGPLTFEQMRYLDRAGNDDGAYDLGDFRAYVLANPSAPTSAQVSDHRSIVVPVLDLAPGGMP